MFHPREALCPIGKRLDVQCLGFITDTSGEPTKLYYHLSDCEDCLVVRESCPEAPEVPK